MRSFTSSLFILFIVFTLTSCIEFEEQELVYAHDKENDEIRMTLKYQGIFGNLDKGQNTQKNSDDVATVDKLNQLQVDQLASVLNEGQAFFFSNWIFEYKRGALKGMLEQVKKQPVPEGRVFGQSEEDLISALLKEVVIENTGFYQDEKGRLCGAQTIKLSNASKVISLAN